MTNTLKAIKSIVSSTTHNIENSSEVTSNRINAVGDSLENYVKDAYSGSYGFEKEARKHAWNEAFSFLGSKNHPPDMMIRGGDAIEVKKIEAKNKRLPLNSSYPKSKLYVDDPLIIQECINCEDWQEKDIVYVIGHVPKKSKEIKSVWFVLGDCYAAHKDIYTRIKNNITAILEADNDLALSETNEIARINQVDPLKSTYLRVRGVWEIEHPNVLFTNHIYGQSQDLGFVLNAIMTKEKFHSFPDEDKASLRELGVSIDDVEITDPNNPEQTLTAIHIYYPKKVKGLFS